MEKKKEKTNKIMLGSQIATVLLLLVVVFQLNGLNANVQALESSPTGAVAANQPAQAAPQPQAAPPSPTIGSEQVTAMLEGAQMKGDKNAPVTIIEFSDFECPFCARFYSNTLPQIEDQYIKTGKVKFAYKHFPLSFHAQAQKAGEASECAGDQGKFWEMHDVLFEKGVAGGVASFKQYAADLNLDAGDFDACLDTGKYADKVLKGLQEGSAVGVRGTPGFLIDGQLVSGAQPFSVFQQVIDAALEN